MQNNVKDSQKQVILIDLDVIMDSRFGTLSYMDTKSALKLLDAGFRQRHSDNWDKLVPNLIDQKVYEDNYKNRGIGILKRSTMTAFMSVLLDIVKQFELDLSLNPDVLSEATLVINLFPYNLSNQDQQMILLTVKEYLGELVNIKLTHEDPRNLNLSYLSHKGYTKYITYDFADWVGYHYNSDIGVNNIKGLPDFQIVAPRLMTNEYSNEDIKVIKEYDLADENPFDLMQILFAATFGLTFIDINFFSIVSNAELGMG